MPLRLTTTAAAPTFFQPLQDGGYTFIDGGLYANDPIMVALVDALSCFELPRENVRILSLGCGVNKYMIDKWKMKGGLYQWRTVIDSAIQLQSFNAQGQAGLLVGADSIVRCEPPSSDFAIGLDDWKSAVQKLVPAATLALDAMGEVVSKTFLTDAALPYTPIAS